MLNIKDNINKVGWRVVDTDWLEISRADAKIQYSFKFTNTYTWIIVYAKILKKMVWNNKNIVYVQLIHYYTSDGPEMYAM